MVLCVYVCVCDKRETRQYVNIAYYLHHIWTETDKNNRLSVETIDLIQYRAVGIFKNENQILI